MQITINHKLQSITADWKVYYYTYFSRLDNSLIIGLLKGWEIIFNTIWANFKIIKKDFTKKWIVKSKKIKVQQYSLNGSFIKTWTSILDIQKELWIHQSNIIKVCKWQNKSAWWFFWKYYNNK